MEDFPILMHTALDATDCRALAEFYRQFLGLRYQPGDETPDSGAVDDADWLVLLNANGHRVMAVNQVATVARPTWPTDEVPKQMHQEFLVPDRAELERHCRRAQELGATLLYDRSAEGGAPLYVLADPAGHPFCLMVAHK